MDELKNHFKGKKITVMGLGLLGRGVGDAIYLADAGAELIITDLKSESELEESAAKLRPYPNVTLKLGGHDVADFEQRDFILVAAGVPKDSMYLEHARENNVPLKMSAALLVELSGLPFIGVTGTRGKTTVTHLITHALRKSGKNVLQGGNVRGVSNLQLLREVESAELLVMELDSWQLQGFGWDEVSPHIAVFTNFMEDHLNYYQDMESYFSDKENIYKYQRPGDILIAGKKVAAEWISAHPAPYGLTQPESVPLDWQLLLPGEHNKENVALAVSALQAYGLNEKEIKEACETFAGVEGRLQYVKTINGVEVYNDNNATTPAATLVALKALDKGKKNIVLICGGNDKGVSAQDLVGEIESAVKQLILYSGSGTDALKQLLPSDVPVTEKNTLAEVVAAAFEVATVGDVVLFSPAFASFGKEYKNEYDRNDKFLSLIEKQ